MEMRRSFAFRALRVQAVPIVPGGLHLVWSEPALGTGPRNQCPVRRAASSLTLLRSYVVSTPRSVPEIGGVVSHPGVPIEINRLPLRAHD